MDTDESGISELPTDADGVDLGELLTSVTHVGPSVGVTGVAGIDCEELRAFIPTVVLRDNCSCLGVIDDTHWEASTSAEVGRLVGSRERSRERSDFRPDKRG